MNSLAASSHESTQSAATAGLGEVARLHGAINGPSLLHEWISLPTHRLPPGEQSTQPKVASQTGPCAVQLGERRARQKSRCFSCCPNKYADRAGWGIRRNLGSTAGAFPEQPLVTRRPIVSAKPDAKPVSARRRSVVP